MCCREPAPPASKGVGNVNIPKIGRGLLWGVVVVLAVAVVAQLALRLQGRDPVIMRSYEVPAEIATEVQGALVYVLSRGASEASLGRVSLLPNGHLVVTAPASVQAGVSHILQQIGDTRPTPTPTIGFDLWVVTATPGPAAQASDALEEIEPALAAIRTARGPLTFELLEKLSTATRSGHEPSSVHGASSRMQIRASLRKGEQDQPMVAAELHASVLAGFNTLTEFKAATEMRPGELLVIGQSALADQRSGSGSTSTQVYYILRASL